MTVMLSPAPARRADNYITSRSFEQRGGYLFCLNGSLFDLPTLQFLSMMVVLSKEPANLPFRMQIFQNSPLGLCMKRAFRTFPTTPSSLLGTPSILSERVLVVVQMVFRPTFTS